ncbi:beta-lactamase regulating signal transducer with metallopeptidase domain [Mesonia algae]|uniref:Beta-lactamase regulating signal transducer with metallopeptidase domain n=1 Tax=Mesonia algae TaxID=213248 RepID=A0A2W7HZY1_9FLAO|nr:M56 family metallopeptidase [Mesonia algae]PZW39618.1 beta-lactamase regulating signal transducer with metallopeptidase domain [Mesonia algae]
MEILLYLLKSTSILGLFFIVYYFALRKDTYFESNRYFLLLGLVCAFSFPFLEFTQITYIETEPISNSVFSPGNEVSSSPVQNFPLAETESFNWLKLLLNLYIVGVIFMGIRFLFQLLSLFNILRLPKKRDAEGFYHIELTKKTSPFSFFHFIGYHLPSYQKNELKLIIEHEKVHGKQYHSIDVMLHQLMLVFLWFNPFAWWYNKQMLENLEFIADRNVTTKNNVDQKEYALTLLKTSNHHHSPSLGNSFYQSLIKKRIVMLHKNASSKYAWAKSILILPLLSLFLWSFNIKEEIKFIPLAENQSTEIHENENLPHKELITEGLKSVKTASVNHLQEVDKTQQQQKTASTIKKTYVITKHTSDKEIRKIKNGLEKELENTKLKFSNIERNNKSEIISLTISSKFKDNESYIKNMIIKGINSFPIELISKSNQVEIRHKDNKISVISTRRISAHRINKNELEDTVIIKEIPLESPVEIIAIQTPNMNENIKNALRTSEQSPLIIINGKESNTKELSLLQPENIENVNIIKKQNAISEYGDKAKYGIIDITLKDDFEEQSDVAIKALPIKEKQNEYIYSINGVKVDKNNAELISPKSLKSINIYNEEDAKNKFNIITGGKKLMNFQLIEDGEEINTTFSKELIKHQISLQNKNSLIILNGKEITRKDLEEIDPKQIKSISPIKGKKAIEKYGKKAKDGAIVITTK